MADQQRAFWTAVAAKYDRVVDLQIGGGTRALARERVGQENHLGTVAEFGCGTGFFTATLARNAGALVATDLSPGMLEVAQQRTPVGNVTFQAEDCQRTSFADCTFDTVFMSLVIHFVDADAALVEMRRILKPGGRLIIANIDPMALAGVDRIRAGLRILYRGITGYQTKPPRGLGKNMLSREQLCQRLVAAGFEVASAETIKDPSRSSNIPVDYVVAVKSSAA